MNPKDNKNTNNNNKNNNKRNTIKQPSRSIQSRRSSINSINRTFPMLSPIPPTTINPSLTAPFDPTTPLRLPTHNRSRPTILSKTNNEQSINDTDLNILSDEDYDQQSQQPFSFNASNVSIISDK